MSVFRHPLSECALCIVMSIRGLGQSRVCSEDGVWRWSPGKGWEAGSLSIKLDDSQPRNQNHSHPREALQIPGGVLDRLWFESKISPGGS